MANEKTEAQKPADNRTGAVTGVMPDPKTENPDSKNESNPEAEGNKPPEAKPVTIGRARVLGGFMLDNVEYHPNDVIEADKSIIKSLGTSVDPDPEAVKYCLEELESAVKSHQRKK